MTGVNGKLYTWGLNDLSQTGVSSLDQSQFDYPVLVAGLEGLSRVRHVAAGGDHSVLIDSDSNVYTFGCNTKNQTGHGVDVRLQTDPELVGLRLAPEENIKQLSVRGNQNYLVSDQGRLFSWPGYDHPDKTSLSQAFNLSPVRFFLQQKVLIAQVAQGLNFALALSTQGLVYSWGSQNFYGELGHGDTAPRADPTLLDHLRRLGEKIVHVSCGQKHSICLSGLGRVYTWGWGERGQLGHGGFLNELVPRQVSLQKQYQSFKPLSVHAAFRSSFVILDCKKIFWWGSNVTTLRKVNLPQEFPLFELEPELQFK